jgi:N-acetyl-anhydromuramyl-L-alanine amidase AmpD
MEAKLLILHYAVDGDQTRDDDEEVDRSFTTRVRNDDCMDVARGFQKPKRLASTHFVVGRDGSKVQCVELKDGCFGAGDRGKSRFPAEPPAALKDVPIRSRYVNLISTQIEICNVGYDVDKFKIPLDERVIGKHPAMRHDREWEAYTDYAYKTVELLVAMLRMAQPTLKWVCGHEDVTNRDTMRKNAGGKFDPGPAWDWDRIPWREMGYQRVRYDFKSKMFVFA